jgi:SAM-dependent methyltransferase
MDKQMTSKIDPQPFDDSNKDDQNLMLATSTSSVEQELSDFYQRFPYPWRPSKFDALVDPSFEIAMLNQNIGDFTHSRIPPQPMIWVAGCGTNQALITALRFPEASVLGSDLSLKSLEICSNNARALGVNNLELERESINRISYKERFDYIICTGVIHHNADPEIPLRQIAEALKPSGILELMVYNRFHRITTSAFQKVVRLINRTTQVSNLELDISTARKLIDDLPAKNALYNSVNFRRKQEEAPFADGLIHPVEHSYTVETINEVAARCGLELLLPCVNPYDALDDSYNWNLEFKDRYLQDQYNDLPDPTRWQVTNLLLFEQSPLLWFYFQRKDSPSPRKTENEICDQFLNTTFKKASTLQTLFLESDDGRYSASPKQIPYPVISPRSAVRDVFEAADGSAPIKTILESLGIEATFNKVNLFRILLTTSAFPYLRSALAPNQPERQPDLKEFKNPSMSDCKGPAFDLGEETFRTAIEQIRFEGDDDESEEY